MRSWLAELEAARSSETEEKFRRYGAALAAHLATCDGLLAKASERARKRASSGGGQGGSLGRWGPGWRRSEGRAQVGALPEERLKALPSFTAAGLVAPARPRVRRRHMQQAAGKQPA